MLFTDLDAVSSDDSGYYNRKFKNMHFILVELIRCYYDSHFVQNVHF